jgi:hypothetical protein
MTLLDIRATILSRVRISGSLSLSPIENDEKAEMPVLRAAHTTAERTTS